MQRDINSFSAKKSVLAICYDFDKTLTPDDMQAQGFIQSVQKGKDVESFWEESNKLARENGMDSNLAYMYLMVTKSRGNNYLTRRLLQEYGSKVQLFNGVETWFDRINAYGKEHNVEIEHYIISSGLKEMIEGTSIAHVFKAIYASSFLYDKDDVAVWPAQAINYTSKTQFLFRVEKGALDVNDPRVNEYIPEGKYKAPFRNIVYIGDSETDIPCMKLVNNFGGHSIGVYNPLNDNRIKVYKMLRDNRIKYFTPADYSQNSELDILIKKIIDKTATYEVLERWHLSNKEEAYSEFDS